MNRGLACMILILAAMLPTVPVSHRSIHTPIHPQLSTYSSQTSMDPNATLTAFNYTYAQADLYTNSSSGFKANSTLPAYAHLSWLQTVPRTSTGGLVPGSAFNFNVTKPTAPGREVVNWTLIIPQFNCQGCKKTEVRFEFFGNLTKGTSASYSLYNGTMLVPLANGQGNNTGTFSGQQPPAIGCPRPNVCVNATSFIGFNLTLTFHLGWNSTALNGPGMSVDVGEVVVTSVDQTFKKSSSNFMFAANSTTVNHQADLRSIVYNATVHYPKGGSSGLFLNHTWSSEVLDIYYPAGYQISQISLNSTTVFPVSPHVAFDTEPCFDTPTCSTSLLALNMSDFPPPASRNSTVVVKMTSPNSVSLLNTLTSAVVINQFLPGDVLTVQVVNKLSAAKVTTLVNPRLNVTIIDSKGSNSSMGVPRLNLPNPSGGNFTSTVPTGPFGTWNVTVTFVSNYDMGWRSRAFSVEEIQVTPSTFGYSGSNNALAAQGTLTYATSNSTTLPASNIKGVVFAVDTGIPNTNPVTTTTPNPSSTSLYIANVTLVNGVFGQTQTLVMTFTIINPTSSLFSANVTIEHEWSTSQGHGVSVTIPLALGDQPFSTQVSRHYPYEAEISFASSPVQVKLTSLTTLNSKTAPLSQGSDPIVPNRQHSGLFKITVNSVSVVLGSSPLPPTSLESPPYAFVPGLPSFMGRYLAYAPFTTRTDGSFSITTSSNAILAAKKLVLFALARDANGVTLVNNQNPGPTDSTILQASLDPISQLTIGQTFHPTLHLTSNASKITEIITVTETLQGSGVVDSQKVTIQPGASQPVSFTLTAPQTVGSYTVTFSSPEYGGPFASQTVQVSVVSSNLQLLIPAAIGLVAAIIVLGYYLVRRTPEKDVEEEKPKSAGPKPRTQPSSGSSTSKSLTQTRDPESR